MPVPIDIRVSPALDPETYRSVEGYNDSTRGYVEDVVGAFNDIYVTLGKLHDARVLAEGNKAWPPEQRILILGREASKQKARLSKRLDRAYGDLKARIAHVEGELSTPLEARALGMLNQEIRSHSKGLNREDRAALIREAMEADDDTTLASILGSPPFLSGLSKEDQAHHIHQYHSRKNPHLVERLAVMRRVQDLIHRNGGVFHKQFEVAVGAKPQDVNAIEGANERALAALNIEPTV